MAATVEGKNSVDLGALLDAGDGAVVTLVAGQTQLAAHRAVLSARSPVFEATFHNDTLEASTGVVTIPDVEDAVLRQLLSYCYTLRAPQLPALATNLLSAADKYGLLDLKSMCEQHVAAHLTNENAAASAVLAVRHSCPNLTEAAIAFIREHDFQALATQGWADAMIKQTQELIQVSRLLAETSTKTRVSRVTPIMEIKETNAVDLGALLDVGDDAMVTLVAGETRLVAHRAVLAARSPELKAMFHGNTLEANSDQIAFPDTEGPALRKFLDYCYTLQVPEPLCVAPQLLVAANKYGLSCLKAACEQQVAADLTVKNAAAAAVLAVRHSCPDLSAAAITFIKEHFILVVGTQGWADTMRYQTEDLIRVSQLLAEPPAEIRSLSAQEKDRRLREAAKQGAAGELEALLAAGADVAARDEKMWTSLHWAARQGHEEAARRLLAAGADVDAKDSWQFTPLHYAARQGHTAVVRLLLAARADRGAGTHRGWTPLHLAAFNGKTQSAAVLLEAGADRGASDNDGLTPLDKAREKNHQQLVDLLQQS